MQVVIGLLILAGALGATVLRNRLAAVLLVGVTGTAAAPSSRSTAHRTWR